MSAQWPSAISTAANLYTAVNLLTTTLSISMTSSTPSVITVASTTGFPTAGAVTIDNEVIFYTGVSGSTLTGLTRGADGTTAASHNSGVPVGATVIANHINALTAEVIAIETDLNARFGFGSTAITVPSGVSFNLKATSNQLVAGTTNTTTMSFTAPSSSRTVTVPDPGADAFFVMTQLAQTIAGVKTFSSNPIMSGLTASCVVVTASDKSLGSSATTVTEVGYVSGVTSAIQTQLNAKAADASVVHTTGNETVAGIKSFSSDIKGTTLGNGIYVVNTNGSTIHSVGSQGPAIAVQNSKKLSFNVNGYAKIFAIWGDSGDGCLVVTCWNTTTITILGTGGSIVASSTPSSGQIGISKSVGDVVDITAGSAAAATNANIHICVFGQLTSITDWR